MGPSVHDADEGKVAPGHVGMEGEEADPIRDLLESKNMLNSKLPEHRHQCAVAMAITEVIQQQGLQLKPSAYFAALMSSLEGALKGPTEVVTAICTLLAMVLPNVPVPVLRSKLTFALPIMKDILTAQHQPNAGPGTSLSRAALQCTQLLIRASPPSDWHAMAKYFGVLLQHCIDKQPKVRKKAHLCVAGVLEGVRGSGSASGTAASNLVVKFCENIFDGFRKKDPSPQAVTDTLHVIIALREIMPFLSAAATAPLCARLASLYGMQHPLVNRTIVDALLALFVRADSELSADVLHALLAAIADVEVVPGGAGGGGAGASSNIDAVVSFTRLMQHGLVRLHAVDAAKCTQMLPRVTHALVANMASEHDEVVYATAECLKEVITGCVDEGMIQAGVAAVMARQGQGEGAAGSSSGGGGGKATPIESLIVAVQSLLGYAFSTCWDMALLVIAKLFERIGKPAGLLMAATVKTMEEMRSRLGEDMPAIEQLELAFGAAIRAMGPAQFLVLVPLRMDPLRMDASLARSWILKLLRQYVRGAELKCFATLLLPLAKKLNEAAVAMAKNNQPVGAKNARSLMLQLWTTFPAFCDHPVDVVQAVRAMGAEWGAVLQHRPELRGLVLAGLKTLASQCRDESAGRKKKHDAGKGGSGAKAKGSEEGDSDGESEEEEDDAGADDSDSDDEPEPTPAPGGLRYTPEEAAANRAALGQLCTPLFPVLFNIYVSSPPDRRGDVQETIRTFASIAPSDVLHDFFVKVMKNMLATVAELSRKAQATDSAAAPEAQGAGAMEAEGGAAKPAAKAGGKELSAATASMCSFMDLALALAVGLNTKAVSDLYTAIRPNILSKEPSLQKKAYKLLCRMCESNAEFLPSHLKQVLDDLLDAAPVCTAAARRHRLECVGQAIKALHAVEGEGEMVHKVIRGLLVETILGTKETNAKTRNTAYALLVRTAHVFANEGRDAGGGEGKGEEEDEVMGGAAGYTKGLHDFFQMVIGGLAGSTPHMVSATVISLTRLVYEFHDAVEELVEPLLQAALLLLRSKSREIIKSVLGFLKVVIVRVPRELLRGHLKEIMEGLLLWVDDKRNQFKQKVRVIVERLVRKYGYDAIAVAIPEEHAKLLTHIRKMKEREQHKKDVRRGKSVADGKSAATGKTGQTKGTARSLARTEKTAGGMSKWRHTEVFSDDDYAASDDEMEVDDGLPRAHTKSVRNRVTSASARRMMKSQLVEGAVEGDDVVDLLDNAQVAHHLVASAPKNARARLPLGDDEMGEEGFGTDDKGMLVIKEQRGKRKRRGEEAEEGGEGDGGQSEGGRTRSEGGRSKGGKSMAGRSQRSGMDARSVGGASSKGGKRGAATAVSVGGRSQAKSARGYSSFSLSGDAFKSKKKGTGGDVLRHTGKHKGKGTGPLEPFAYWPLDPKMLNPREAKKKAARNALASVVGDRKAKRAKVGGGGPGSQAGSEGWSKKGGRAAKAHKGKTKGSSFHRK
eukprot:jgi/Mesvir1/19116/Mv12859-RA.1